ncbi:hypothetical protein EDB89DRAFT_1482568 [Lactarius sanguifluus]|nr:hypothetical protein EDB89DRAFT_1482568 [Lactarius sanguifluus]
MVSDSISTSSAGVLVILVLLLIYSRQYRLPPGPPSNVAVEFAKSPMPVLFDRWRKQYGMQHQPTAMSCLILCRNLLRSDILFQNWDKTCYRYGYQAPVLPSSLKTQQS